MWKRMIFSGNSSPPDLCHAAPSQQSKIMSSENRSDKDIVNNVVFPVIDMILAVLLFVKIATAYMDYRKHGQFEFTAPAILFACLLFSLTAPSYIWNIL